MLYRVHCRNIHGPAGPADKNKKYPDGKKDTFILQTSIINYHTDNIIGLLKKYHDSCHAKVLFDDGRPCCIN